MIQQIAVAVGSALQLVEEVRQTLHVIPADLGIILDPIGILGVVRSAVEAGVGSTGGKAASGQVASVQHTGHARGVITPAQRGQIEVQLDVFVEGLRNSGGNRYVFAGGDAAGFLGVVQAAL